MTPTHLSMSHEGKEILRQIVEGLEGVTGGPWHPGCLANDESSCNCRSIIDEGYAGGIATVHMDNGKLISDGGNGAPPEHEAKANLRHLARCSPDAIRAISAYVAAVEKERDSLRAALEPFAKIGGHMRHTPPARSVSVVYMGVEYDGLNSHSSSSATVGAFRRARAALKGDA